LAHHGHGRWLLRTVDTARPVGYVKLERRALDASVVVELGYALERDSWGNGYATEAAAAALDWGWSNLAEDVIVAVIVEDNTSSMNVARRLGFNKRGTTEQSGVTHEVYELRRCDATLR
jgi:RimJ/RimL family protein N-acetyltransferase